MPNMINRLIVAPALTLAITSALALGSTAMSSVSAIAQERPAAEQGQAIDEKPVTEEQDTSSVGSTEATEGQIDLGKLAEVVIPEQDDDQVSAGQYIGHAVYNFQGENIGDINDLLFDKDGGIVAAVIGVGGFLGMGEKNVAVAFSAIQVREDSETGAITLSMDASADQLAAAPELVTKFDRIAQSESRRLEQEQQRSTGNTSNVPTPLGNN